MYKRFFKRLFDILFSLISIPLFFFVFIIVAPMIYLEDRGSVFYNAPRMGKNGKVFKMYKFRSMYVNAPDIRNADGSTYNGDKDSRVTRMGRIMRKTSIDEMPQLFNVLKGDMSFVGPRPNLANRSYDAFDETRRKRVTVRPGITGYSQAYFRNSILQDQKFRNDCYYVEHISLLFDAKILFKTIIAVLLSRNVYVDQTVNRN